ncbi:MAG: PHB depolymerase family esterase [Alphaproteobacteria bacterium]|nr:PHB depolymerase family esterase [Alphaproteobacteria bacterium]
MEKPVPLAGNVDFFSTLSRLNGLHTPRQDRSAGLSSPLQEITGFGSNPGNLRMFSFVPAEIAEPRALVVVLHGCGQTAAGYDLGSGWSTLARHFRFALLFAEQRRLNNVNTCFNWFNSGDISRGRGEACSIRQMIAHSVALHGIDPKRISITGLSAGGAMTAVMLAAYPEVFAAGAIIAGLPYGVASGMRQAIHAMRQSTTRSAAELGDLVRQASDHRGPWPRVSVWHGSADPTVDPDNADAIVRQWLNLHGLSAAPAECSVVSGYPRRTWSADGQAIVESFTITDMAHGTPLGLGDNDERYGVSGAFMIEAGISSSYHIAKFFGVTDRARPAPQTAAAHRPPPDRIEPEPAAERQVPSAAERPAPARLAWALRAILARALKGRWKT